MVLCVCLFSKYLKTVGLSGEFTKLGKANCGFEKSGTRFGYTKTILR